MILRSHTRRQSRLPPELIDRIIDYLHDSPADLHTCARVCRAWLDPSRFHLFYTVSIRLMGDRKSAVFSKYRKLYNIIRRCPRIAFHVRELRVGLGYHFWVLSGSTWLKITNILPPLLQSFTRIRKLQICDVGWASLTPDLRKSFRDLTALPSLVQLEVRLASFVKLDDLRSLIQPSLTRLLFSAYWHESGPDASCILDVENEQAALQEQRPCPLESLTLGAMFEREYSQFVDWILGAQSVIDISNLRALDVWCHPDRRQQITTRLVRGLGSSLEHLTIRHGVGRTGGEPFLFP
jgi:hypothetical protein